MGILTTSKKRETPDALAEAAAVRNRAVAAFRTAEAAYHAARDAEQRLRAPAADVRTQIQARRGLAAAEDARLEAEATWLDARVTARAAEAEWKWQTVALYDAQARERFEALVLALAPALAEAARFQTWAAARDAELLDPALTPVLHADAHGQSRGRYDVITDPLAQAEASVAYFVGWVRAQFGWPVV